MATNSSLATSFCSPRAPRTARARSRWPALQAGGGPPPANSRGGWGGGGGGGARGAGNRLGVAGHRPDSVLPDERLAAVAARMTGDQLLRREAIREQAADHGLG